jgi:hypothetical protein
MEFHFPHCALIHLSAWNRNSQKFISRIVHNPTPIRAENGLFPARVRNPKPYMLCRCISMSSVA